MSELNDDVRLDFEQRAQAISLESAVIKDPLAAAYKIVGLRKVTAELVDAIAQGIIKSASLLCDCRGHVNRGPFNRPCLLCQHEIRKCFPYAPEE